MVKDHSQSERGNPLPPHGLLFPINSIGSYICTIPETGCTYHGLCYTSRGTLAGTRNSSMGSPHEGSIQRHIAPCSCDGSGNNSSNSCSCSGCGGDSIFSTNSISSYTETQYPSGGNVARSIPVGEPLVFPPKHRS